MSTFRRRDDRWCRLLLERLETRLPLGDALLGPLLGFQLLNEIDGPLAADASVDIRRTERMPIVSKSTATASWRWCFESVTPDRPSHTHSEELTAATEVVSKGELNTCDTSCRIVPMQRVAGAEQREPPDGQINASAIATSPQNQRAAGFTPADLTAGINTGSARVSDPAATSSARVSDPAARPSSLTFEANHGQTDSRVDFITRANGATVFLTPTAAVFSMQKSEVSAPGIGFETQHSALSTQHPSGAAIYMNIDGANPNSQPVAQDRLPGIVNYFRGNDPTRWHTNIPTFEKVQYTDVYAGIDLAYYGNGSALEYDFVVGPGADPDQIQLNFAGADSINIDADGSLVVQAGNFLLRQNAPYIYQEIDGTRQQVPGSFSLSTQHSALSTAVWAAQERAIR